MSMFEFTVETVPVADTTECRITLSAFEAHILDPLPTYALDMLRQRLLFALTSDHFLTRSARVMLQTVLETEMTVLFTKLITISPDVAGSHVCLRRHYIDVDADMKKFEFLIEPALVELSGIVPDSYVRFLRRYLAQPYARYRVSALSAVICLAVAHND